MTFEQANKDHEYEEFGLGWHICLCDSCGRAEECYIFSHPDLQEFGNSVDQCNFYKRYEC